MVKILISMVGAQMLYVHINRRLIRGPPPPIPLPTFTKYYNNDPNLRNLLSSDRIINKMLAALWKMGQEPKTATSTFTQPA